MLAVLSPAKKLDFGLLATPHALTSPLMTRQATRLAKTVRLLSAEQLGGLMKLSDKLAELNHERFQTFAAGSKPRGAKQAALAFSGDTYQGFAAWDFDDDDLEFAQQNVGILSGLYGLLRPLDAIQPHRLEMGTRLITEKGRNLYDYWGPQIARLIDTQLSDHAHPVVINLASTEYFGAVDTKALQHPVIHTVFQEEKQGARKVIGLFAKRARGMMARYIVRKRIVDPAKLRFFREGGYRYDARASTDSKLVFYRAAATAVS